MHNLAMINLAARLETDDVRRLLLALGYPAATASIKVERVIAEYQNSPYQPILVAELNRELLGLIGIRLESITTAVIRHLVVQPTLRHHGVGRAMICAVWEQFRLNTLTAETDLDAVDFYRCCGFQVESLGELYPGIERFRCILRR